MGFLKMFKSNDLVSLDSIKDLVNGLNKKNEIEASRKANVWLIVGLVVLGLALAGVIVYFVFFAKDSYDEFDDYDDYEDDYDEFDDLDDLEDYLDEEEGLEEVH